MNKSRQILVASIAILTLAAGVCIPARAGDVQVFLEGRTLHVFGSADADAIRLECSGLHCWIWTGDYSTTINGQGGVLLFYSEFDDLVADMGAGDDRLRVDMDYRIPNPLLPGGLDVELGSGADWLMLEGTDTFEDAGYGRPLQINGDLLVRTGEGHDFLEITRWVAVTGRFAMTTERGDDSITVDGILTVAGAARIETGLHDDLVDLGGLVTIGSDLTVELGQGTDQLAFASKSDALIDVGGQARFSGDQGNFDSAARFGALSINALGGTTVLGFETLLGW